MYRILFLAIFAALLLKTIGAVCEGILEQGEEKLVTVGAVCQNQTLTLSWNRSIKARPTPFRIECKNGTRTIFAYMPSDDDYALPSPSGTTDTHSSIFQWPVQCTLRVCYSNLNVRTSFSVHPAIATCSFPNPSAISSFPVSSTAPFLPSTKDFPTTIDRKASIEPKTSPLHPESATTAPSITNSMKIIEQNIISSSLNSINSEIVVTATGSSVTMLTTQPANVTQQTVSGAASSTHLALTQTEINTTVIQMPSNVGGTENVSLSMTLSITIPVTTIVLAITVIISLCWMIMKRIKKPDDYTNSAVQEYDPVILSLTKPYICGSTITLTYPLESQPTLSMSEEQASSELERSLAIEGIENTIKQEEDHLKPSQSPWDHNSASFTDIKSDVSSQESSQTVCTQGYIFTRRHSYESLAYIHQSDYIVPCSIDNIY